MQIPEGGYLDGQFLVAMPGMPDDRFSRSLVYVCAHSAEGAMGIVVNRPSDGIEFPELLAQLDIIPSGGGIRLPGKAKRLTVLSGGPVETGRGFVLHSSDFYVDNSTLAIDDGVSLTATVDILRAIARGDGPTDAIFALGYAGWRAGQLESEINGNGWLNCPSDKELLFDHGFETKYERALRKIGIDPGKLSSSAGHA